jgi:SNF2 family DNA or RNA helicase
MTWVGRTMPTRPAPLSYQEWVPEPYMLRAVQHLVSHHSGGLALDPGMRKTSITLEAFCQLQESGLVKTMLVIAPLRICRKVWRQEGAKWAQFRHLTFTLLHGDKKDAALKERSDIYLINPEGVEWLAHKFFGRPLPFDVVTIDELTKFKNAASERSKALRPRLKATRYRWGLTGSLAPNGFMDIFGQMLMLDDGAALGRYITHYRDQYFQLGYDGFTYELMPGAEQRIIQRIAPYWLQLSADDYLELPELVMDVREIEMGPASRKTYDKMKRDMIASLPEGIVTAANAAACYSKLAQMANGAVYVEDK